MNYKVLQTMEAMTLRAIWTPILLREPGRNRPTLVGFLRFEEICGNWCQTPTSTPKVDGNWCLTPTSTSEGLVRPMNMAMRMTQNRAALANVANAFRKEPESVAFRLTWMNEMPPVLIDPHPTALGHQLIFEELMKGRNPRSF